jgi:uncharacterized protein (TIGR02996 family)
VSDVEQTLLDEIYAALDDDGPRSIYPDYLIERGDPRGTFSSRACGSGIRRRPTRNKRSRALAEYADARGMRLVPHAMYFAARPRFSG